MQRQELPNNTIEQVKEYVLDALTLTESVDPPDDLRAAVFTAAVNLISGKQIVMTQPQPMDLRGLGLKAGFLFATLAGFGWVLTWDLGTVLGLIAAGLGFWVASTLDTSISL
jgi:hypothetical protein